MKDLQKKETELVNQEEKIQNIKNDLLKKEKLLNEQNVELENRIENHKKKSLKLLERENKVSVKESIETIQKDLLNISVSISQLLDVLSEPILEDRIQQIINKLNEIRNTSDENLEQPVIVATEVVPRATVPPPGYYASLTSLFGK